MHRNHTLRRVPVLLGLLAMTGLLVVSSLHQPGYAQDDREYQNLTRAIERDINNARVTDVDLIRQIQQLNKWPNKRTTQFLVEKVLVGFENARRVNRRGVEPTVVALLQEIAEKDEDSATYLAENTFNERLPETLRFRLIEAQLKGEGAAEELFEKGLDAENWAVRVLLLNYIAQHGNVGDKGFEGVRKSLFHADRRVRTAAVRAIERLCVEARTRSEREIACFEGLIDLLEREQSGLKPQVRIILEGLTNLRLGEEADAWRTWLAAYREGRAPDIREEAAGTGVRRDYYDIELPKKMIFVVDLSVSMDDRLENKDEIRQRLERNQPRGYDWNQIHTLLDLARAEFERAVGLLSPPAPRERRGRGDRGSTTDRVGDGNDGFTVIMYAAEAVPWSEKLQPATDRNKRDVIDWSRRTQVTGLTNVYDALDLAFRIAGEDRREGGPVTTGGEPQEPEAAAEAIFFLTDGFATIGKYHHNNPRDTMQRVDTNRDQRISFDEFLAVFDLAFITEDTLRRSFNTNLDTNNDGYIDMNELTQAQNWFYAAQMDNLVNEFTKRNEMLHLQIHCIGIGPHDTRTLGLLAERNNGTYVNLGH